ncbi:MAG: hypothetical protein IVW56_09950 [Candidatus Binataceae bacterium]|nr:hypothetical protein [Candidatus Binataceae bacterium]
MKFSEHDFWPPKWGADVKPELPADLPYLVSGFREKAVLDQVYERIDGDPLVVTIGVKHPDRLALIAGDLWVGSKETQLRLHAGLSALKGRTIHDIGNLPFD